MNVGFSCLTQRDCGVLRERDSIHDEAQLLTVGQGQITSYILYMKVELTAMESYFQYCSLNVSLRSNSAAISHYNYTVDDIT